VQLLSLPYPAAKDIRNAAQQIVPQLINAFHMHNLWRDYSELNYLQRLLKILVAVESRKKIPRHDVGGFFVAEENFYSGRVFTHESSVALSVRPRKTCPTIHLTEPAQLGLS